MRKLLVNLLFLSIILFPIVVSADEVIYDKALNDANDYFVMRGVATKDGGYAVLARRNDYDSSYDYSTDPDRDKLFIIKYSADGEMKWTKKYSLPNAPEDCRDTWEEWNPETQQYETKCGKLRNDALFGFAELDNGNLILISNYFRFLISDAGDLISTIWMDNDFYDFIGFRCDSEGDGTACVGIGGDEKNGRERIMGMAFKVYDDGSIDNVFKIPDLQIVISDNAPSIGVPVSFFRNNDGNYVMETIEGIIPWLCVLDSNLKQISKTPVLIRNSSINIIEQIGDIYWINGQFSNNDYFGAYIKYAGTYSLSKTSYVTYSSTMNTVLLERKIAEASIDIQDFLEYGIHDDETARFLAKSGAVGIIGLLDGFRDGKYISLFDADFKNIINSSDTGRTNIDYEYNFLRLNSNLEEIDSYQLVKSSSSNDNFITGGLFSSVLRLADGSDIILTNVMEDGTIGGRHVKFSKKNTVTPAVEGDSDVSFEKTVYEPGEVVKIQLRSKEGYYVDKVIVKDAEGNEVEVDEDDYTFIMPDSDVTVEVQYREIKQVDGGILISIILSLLALGLVGFLNIRYFKKQKPIGM